MPSCRAFCELSENHKIIKIRPTKQKLWPLKNVFIIYSIICNGLSTHHTPSQVIEQLRACEEIASSRTNNWQAFCLKEKSESNLFFLYLIVKKEGNLL